MDGVRPDAEGRRVRLRRLGGVELSRGANWSATGGVAVVSTRGREMREETRCGGGTETGFGEKEREWEGT